MTLKRFYFIAYLTSQLIFSYGIAQSSITLPGKLQKIDTTRVGKDLFIVGIDLQGKVVKLTPDQKNWQDLSLPSQAQSISIGGDGTLWVTDVQDDMYRYVSTTWKKISGKMQKIYVGNKHEVYGINKDGNVYRAQDPTSDSPVWTLLPDKMSDLSSGGDGWIYGIARDMSVKVFNRATKTWSTIIKPAAFGFDNPISLSGKDYFSRVMLNVRGIAWQVSPGTDGRQAEHWLKLTTLPLLKELSIGYDGTLVGIDMQNNVLLVPPTDAMASRITQAHGTPVYSNQIIQLSSGVQWNFDKVWTQAASIYDPDNSNKPPQNHLELLVGVQDKKTDFRDQTASFFSFINSEKPMSSEPLVFGDSIEIFSLYAAPGFPSKSGRLGRSYKWWVHQPHFKWAPCKDIVVSMIDHPSTHNGSQLFKIVSPYGRTGIIGSHDTIELVSLADPNKPQKVWVNSVSRFEGYKELLVNSLPDKDPFYGAQDTSGFQYFRVKSINSVKDFEQCPKTPAWLKDNDPLKVTAQDVFFQLSEVFLKKAETAEQEKKTQLAAQVSAGHAVLVSLRNETHYSASMQIQDSTTTVNTQDSTPSIQIKLFQPLTIKGFAKQGTFENFAPGQMIKLGNMYSKGYAWLHESFTTPGKATLTFLAQAQDKGGIEVIFDTQIGTDAQLKIVIGGWNNTKSAILYKGKEDTDYVVISETDVKNNPLAGIAPGRFIPYWVSINQGFIMVGLGQPGESIFMSGFLPEPPDIIHYGFGSQNALVNYTEIQTGQSLVPLASDKIYSTSEKILDLSPGTEFVPLDLALRVPGEGTISFKVQAENTVTCALLNAQGESYKIIIGADDNKNLILMRNEHIITKLSTSFLPGGKLNSNDAQQFWISLVNGQIMVGQGTVGNNVLLVWQDSNPLSEISRIGFIQSNNQQKISAVTSCPPVTLGTENAEVIYGNQMERFAYRGKVTIIRPFEYQLAQIGQSVTLKNILTGKVFSALATPQQTGEYPFRLTLDTQGIPSLELTVAPQDSPMKIELQKEALLNEVKATLTSEVTSANAEGVEAVAAGLHGVATSLMQVARGGELVGMVAWGVGTAITAAALGMQITAGGIRRAGERTATELRTEARLNRVQDQFAFRAHNSYVLTENAPRPVGAETSVPQEAQTNYDLIQQKFNELMALDVRKPDDYRTFINAYDYIINLINHPYLASSAPLKKRVFDDLEKVMRYAFSDKKIYEDVIRLLLNAMTNAYLIDQKNSEDIKTKEEWYNTVIDLGDKLLRYALSDPNNEITLPPMYGYYLWLPGTITDGQGWVTFQAKGQNDLFVCFSQEITNPHKKEDDLYEIVFGAWDNKRSEIHIQSLGSAAAWTSDKFSLLRTLRPYRYWALFDKDTISLGKDQKINESPFLTWKDPAPWKDIKYIGLGSWDAPVTLSMLKTNIQTGEQAANDEDTEVVVLSSEEEVQAHAAALTAKKASANKLPKSKAPPRQATPQPEPHTAPTQQQTQARKNVRKKEPLVEPEAQKASPVSTITPSTSPEGTHTYKARDANVGRRRTRR